MFSLNTRFVTAGCYKAPFSAVNHLQCIVIIIDNRSFFSSDTQGGLEDFST